MSPGDLEDMPLSDLFREELMLQGARMTTLLARPASRDMLADLGLAAHSARGAAKIVGFDVVAALAQAVELLAGAARDGRVKFGPAAATAVASAKELMLAAAALPEPDWPAWIQAHTAEVARLGERLAELRR